ncbi:unnamed protein product, partial [Vitis vinifera]|uniref:CLAVATA3/ESR (CLE)-related protein 46 n=1 Tax=Vitis vinifera TaxID=29760 RepID=D7TLV5_VITVI|eukprot:XP_010658588.1 PREDICTED: CLAVATA3/ESR (CLE)-related protein 46 isoform X2 [Vitis vinifera]
MHKIMPKMKKKQILAHLILAFLLTASQCYYTTAIMLRAMEPVASNTGPAQQRTGSATRYMFATWKFGQQIRGNIHKVPSGPNPIGNRHPPSYP